MLGENIKNLRKENKMSQEELAEKLDVSRQSISLWETGKTQPTLDLVIKLAELFEVSTDELLNEVIKAKSENISQGAVAKKDVKTQKNIISICIAFILIIFCVVLFVVNIFNNNFSNDPKAIEKASKSVVLLNCYDKKGDLYSTGSGFALLEDDIIVTNYHVIQDNVYKIEINTDSGDSFDVESVVVADEENDIAILKSEKPLKLTHLDIGNSQKMHKGEKVIAIGSPLGLINTVSEGVFSGYLGEEGAKDILQFSASISSGSSGGALFNKKGRVIGITFASFEEGQNLNLAVPIEKVVDLWKNKKESDVLSVADFYDTQTPTYDVEYVLNNYNELIGREVFIEGYVSAHRYWNNIYGDYMSWINLFNDETYVNYPSEEYELEYVMAEDELLKQHKGIVLNYDKKIPLDVLGDVYFGDKICAKVCYDQRTSKITNRIEFELKELYILE